MTGKFEHPRQCNFKVANGALVVFMEAKVRVTTCVRASHGVTGPNIDETCHLPTYRALTGLHGDVGKDKYSYVVSTEKPQMKSPNLQYR